MPGDPTPAESFTWSVEGHPIRISCPAPLIESIRHAAWEGLQKVPRRGLEIGGVLFGTRKGDELEITLWRPIPCEHSKGPGFELSAKDEAELKQILESAASDPELKPLEPLGWFHTHTREGVALSKYDLDIHNRFFPASWQVALVVRPHAYEPARAGFFFREVSGAIRSDSSHKEFILQAKHRRLPAGFDPSAPPPEPPSPARPGKVPGLAPPFPPPAPPPVPEFAPSLPPLPPQPRPALRRWFFALPAAILFAAAGIFFGLPLVKPHLQSEALALAVSESGDDLLLEWNRSSALLLQASSSTLAIEDGDRRQDLILPPEELRTGSFAYHRQTGDVLFRLTLTFPDREPVSDAVRFLGAPLASDPVPEDPAEIGRLQAEIGLLRKELEREAARARKLRQDIQALEKQLTPGTRAP